MSASLFPPACSLLAGNRSAGCRRRWQGRGSLGRTAPEQAAPSPGYQPLPSPSPWVPVPHCGEIALCLQQWLAGQGEFSPCSFVRVVGRGEALHLIILRIFLCCGCHYCSAHFACLFPLGKNRVEGVKSRLGCLSLSFGKDGKKHSVLLAQHGALTVLPHMRGAGLLPCQTLLQHRMCAPHPHS